MSVINKWKETSRKTVFNTKRYPIESVDFLRLDNQPWNEVFIRREPDAVGIFAVTEDQKVIVIRHFRPGPEKIITELPAGDVENEKPMTSARNELLEETGFLGNDVCLVGTSYRDAYSTGKFLSVVITGCTFEGIPQSHQKHSGLREVSLIEISAFKDILFTQKMTNAEAGFRGLHYLKLL